MNKQDLRIVFFGTPEFAVASLDALVKNGYNVVGAVTMPDKPAGRGHKLYQSPIKEYAVEHGIKLLQPVKLKDPEFLDELRALDAQLFIVIAFRMLPEAVWTMPPLGTFNLHASLLPRYRGAAPINRAIMNGDTQTGVTTFMLKHEIDTGDVLRQEKISVGPDENVGSVHDRLMTLGADLTLDTVNHIIAGDLKPIPQSELIGDTEPTPAPKIFTEDCIIDWKRPAKEVHNHIRGLAPYPAARSEIRSDCAKPEILKIFESRLTQELSKAPAGTVLIDQGQMKVVCGDQRLISILQLQAPGKKRMTTDAFLLGARLVNAKFS